MVTKTDELLENAKKYAEAFDKADVQMPPATKVAVVACMTRGSIRKPSWASPRAPRT